MTAPADRPIGPLPRLVTEVPGPRSRALADRLRKVECRNVTYVEPGWPVFWEAGRGACVRDADGNDFLDFTAAFAVAALGHADPVVAEAAADQAARLPHGMGDVHPTELKVRLAEELAALPPGELCVSTLCCGGAEAVDTALKTAALATGRHGVIAFQGAYHGLTGGALEATARAAFRTPFRGSAGGVTRHLPYPVAGRHGAPAGASVTEVLARVEELLAHPDAGGGDVGAILVEPVQGRGGVRVPAEGFLPGLRRLADRHGVVLVFDEIYTGFGRTGEWFAGLHEGVVPDLMAVGKAMGGGFPISACLGRRAVMDAWPESRGEALHTSTFLGNPLGCAMALAAIGEMRRIDAPAVARRTGAVLREMLGRKLAGRPEVVEIRGRGMMLGVELAGPGPDPRATGAAMAVATCKAALRRGLLLLPAGGFGNVLSVSPPLVLDAEQADVGTDILAASLAEAAG